MRGAREFVEKMGRVQRMRVLQVTQALQTTPNDLLDTHAGLELIGVRIRRVCVSATARIAMLLRKSQLRGQQYL